MSLPPPKIKKNTIQTKPATQPPPRYFKREGKKQKKIDELSYFLLLPPSSSHLCPICQTPASSSQPFRSGVAHFLSLPHPTPPSTPLPSLLFRAGSPRTGSLHSVGGGVRESAPDDRVFCCQSLSSCLREAVSRARLLTHSHIRNCCAHLIEATYGAFCLCPPHPHAHSLFPVTWCYSLSHPS